MSDNFEEMRREQVEIQKKQLFAQRVTAASAAATALATHRAAASLEEMRQDARLAAEATAEHQREMQELQQRQLVVVEEEARSAAKEREYQRQVLFLKESDDSTKLEAFLEMHKERVSSLYNLPELPEECKEDGEITRRIEMVIDTVTLPAEAKKLKSEVETVGNEIAKLEAEEKELNDQRNVVFFVCGGLILFGLFKSFVFGMNTYVRNAVFWSAGILIFLTVVERKVSAPKTRARKQKMVLLGRSKTSLEKELQPFLDEMAEQVERARAENMDEWQAVVEVALLQSFFDQGLWIEDSRFTERLKVALTQIQRPFPTSCRTDVNNLRPDQISLAYQTFTDEVADLISMCSAIGKDDDDKLNRGAKLRPRVLKVLRSGPVSLENEKGEVQQAKDRAQREAEVAAQRFTATRRELEAQSKVEAQREAARQREGEAAEQRKAGAQQVAKAKLELRAERIGTVVEAIYIWIVRILGILGSLAGILILIDAIVAPHSGKAGPDDLGTGGKVLAAFVMLLIFGGLATYGFWPRKKKTTSS